MSCCCCFIPLNPWLSNCALGHPGNGRVEPPGSALLGFGSGKNDSVLLCQNSRAHHRSQSSFYNSLWLSKGNAPKMCPTLDQRPSGIREHSTRSPIHSPQRSPVQGEVCIIFHLVDQGVFGCGMFLHPKMETLKSSQGKVKMFSVFHWIKGLQVHGDQAMPGTSFCTHTIFFAP